MLRPGRLVKQVVVGLGFMAAAISGCGAGVFTVEDVVIGPGRPARLETAIDRMYGKASVADTDVSFIVADRVAGKSRTNGDGVATLTTPVPPGVSSYRVMATVDGGPIYGEGRIFHWDPGRTIVAVDVDDTISRTDYADLFVSEYDTKSKAFDDSPQALRVIADHYHLLYVSARPRWLHEKTKTWLASQGFPPGPVLHAHGFDACFHQGVYKEAMLAEFQRHFPNLLIGIGDKRADDLAYGSNRMLTVILGRSDAGYRSHCVVVPDWRSIGEFFDTHTELSDAGRVAGLIQASNMNLRAILAGSGTVASAGLPRGRSGEAAAPGAREPVAPRPSRKAPAPSAQADAVRGNYWNTQAGR